MEKYFICNTAEDDTTIIVDLTIDQVEFLTKIFDQLNDNRNMYAPTISLNKI